MQDIRDTPASSLVEEKRFVVTIKPDDTMKTAIALLKEHNITGLPVFSEERGWLGFISVFEVMAYVAYFSHVDTDPARAAWGRLDAQVEDVMQVSEENKSEMWKAYGSDETLGSLAARFSAGIHRMLIGVNDNAKLLTQTDILKYILKHDPNNDNFTQTLEALNLGHHDKKMVSLPHTETVERGFKKIFDLQAGAIPVTDGDKVVATLSASDTRFLSEDTIDDVLLPIPNFLEKHAAARSPVVVSKTSKLSAVVQKMLDGRIHRVWLVEDEGKLSGVVTMSDVIGLFFK